MDEGVRKRSSYRLVTILIFFLHQARGRSEFGMNELCGFWEKRGLRVVGKCFSLFLFVLSSYSILALIIN